MEDRLVQRFKYGTITSEVIQAVPFSGGYSRLYIVPPMRSREMMFRLIQTGGLEFHRVSLSS